MTPLLRTLPRRCNRDLAVRVGVRGRRNQVKKLLGRRYGLGGRANET
jgi:hypothetical protein